MNEQIIGAAIGIVTTIIGGIFGYFLSDFGARRREVREAKTRSQSVKLIVGMEIDRNLEALGDHWATVQAAGVDATGDLQRRIRADVFLNTPLLPFNRESFRGQLNNLPGAISHEMIRRVFRLYDALSVVETFRMELNNAQADQQSELSKFRQSQSAPGQPQGLVYAPRRPFDSKAEQNWDAVEKAIKEALTAGNPLST